MTVFNTLSETDLAISASKRLKQSSKSLLTLQSFIPNALNDLADKICWDPHQRYLLMTDQSTVTASITGAGSRNYASLSDVISNYGVMLDAIRLGTVMFMPSVTATPYALNNGTYASGFWTFVSNPQPNETIAVNGVTFTFISSSAVVTGAGDAAFNGTYTRRGVVNGKAYFNLVGQPDDYQTSSIFWDVSYWLMTDSGSNTGYWLVSDTDDPWDGAWSADPGGTAPAPTVTEGTFTATQVETGTDISTTRTNFITKLNDSANASINVATYAAGTRNVVTITYDTQGTGGNSFTLANSSNSSITRSAATLAGGSATGYALSINEYTDFFEDLTRVQFSTTVTLPTGISASTNYYLTNYTIIRGSAISRREKIADVGIILI